MPPVRYDTRIYPGATFSAVIEVPWDITGAAARLQVRQSRQPRGVVAEFESDENNTVVMDAEARRITVRLSPAFTEQLPPARYVYDLDLCGAGGEVNRILTGVVHVRRR